MLKTVLIKCSSSCGEGTRYREVYCRDDQTSLRLSGHMCNKDKIPTTEESCQETKCNAINDDLDSKQSYTHDRDQSSNEVSIEQVGWEELHKY